MYLSESCFSQLIYNLVRKCRGVLYCLPRVLGVLQPPVLRFTAVGLTLAGRVTGSFGFCWSENCFHVDKNLWSITTEYTENCLCESFYFQIISCVCQVEPLLHLHLLSVQQRCMLIYVQKHPGVYKQTWRDFFF